jgi:hypothetical protein
MSNISSTHSIQNNEDGKAAALSDNRLVTCWWKQTAEMKAKGEVARKPIAASIPLLSTAEISANIQILMPHITSYLESVQDKIVRTKAESGASEIPTEELNTSAICSYLDMEGTSNRLTKESVSAWFMENIAELLTVSLADKLGVSDTPTPEQVKRLEQMVSVVRDKIATLAGSKTTFSAEHASKLCNVLKLAPTGDALAAKFITRLEGIQKNDSDLFDAL